MYKKHILSTIILIGLSAPITSANAFFEIIAEDPAPKAQTVRDSAYLTQSGTGSAIIVDGKADNASVKDSLSMLLPQGWTNNVPATVGAQTVSWSGGKPWIVILEDIGKQVDQRFIIDWSRKMVISKPVSTGEALPSRVARATGATSSPAPAASKAIESNLAPAPSASKSGGARPEPKIRSAAEYEAASRQAQRALLPAPTTNSLTGSPVRGDAPSKIAAQWVMPSQWEMRPGSLKSQLSTWIRTARYEKVDWQVAGDYQLGGAAVFNGNISHALLQLQEALTAGGIPIVIEEFDNKVILVRELY